MKHVVKYLSNVGIVEYKGLFISFYRRGDTGVLHREHGVIF